MGNEENEKVVNSRKDENLFLKSFKNLLLSFVVYFIGYMNWSITWVILAVIIDVYNNERKKKSLRRRNFVREAALGNEQKIILESIDELPAWVYFPDIERAEWMNKIIKQFWPNVNHYARNFIMTKAENILKSRLEKYSLKGFKFERVILGSVPFRIDGIIVYDSASRDEIVMDVDISYAGDCEIKFRLKGFKGGIKNFQFYGKLRVVLKPLINSLPLVGGIQAFLLNSPDIDFDLDGIAGLLETPGANDLLKKSILDTVSSLMVLPNKFPIKLSEKVSGAQLKTPTVAGVLRIHVIEAKDLVKKDIGFTGKGKSDPYAILEVGDEICRTETIDSTVDPEWDSWCEFVVLEFSGQHLNITVWDEDPTKDEFLGRSSLDISNLIKTGPKDLWLNLEDIKHGKIHIRCIWMSLTTDYSLLQAAIYESQQLNLTNINSALLIVYIDSATSLPQVKVSSKPDPYVQIQVGRQIKCTDTVLRTINPVWEEGFIFFVSNPDSEFLELEVLDGRTDNKLCSLSYNISNLSNKENLEIVEQPFKLENTVSNSNIVLSLHLKILKNDNNESDEVCSAKRRPSSASNTETLLDSEMLGGSLITNNNSDDAFDRLSKSTRSSMMSTSSRSKSSKSRLSEDMLFSGKIKLSLRYSQPRQKLIVVVHCLSDIPHRTQSERNLYVKLYLLPERNKQVKRKTSMKSSSNLVYDKSFEYLVSQGELDSKKLEISVIEERTMKNCILGKVLIDLGRLDILKTHTSWFELVPHMKRD